MKRKILIAAVLLLVLLFVGWSFVKEWDTIQVFPWKVKPVDLLLSLLAYSVQLLLMFVTWHRMMRSMVGKIPFGLDANVYFLSAAARRIPTPVWYLGSRFTLYPPDVISPAVVVVCSVLEVALILLGGLVFLVFTMPFAQVIPSPYAALSILAGAVLLIIFYRSPNALIRMINQFFDWFKKKRVEANITRKNLFEWLGLYLLVYLLNGISMYFLITGIMDVRLEAGAVMAVATVYLILAYISMFLTGGFGLKELATSFFFARWMPIPIGIVVTLLYRVLMTAVELLFVGVVKLLVARQGVLAAASRREEV